MGLSYRTEIQIESDYNLTNKDWKLFLDNLNRDIEKYGKEISKEKKSLEKWVLFINPYTRLKRIIDRYVERLNELDLDSVVIPTRPKTEKEINEYGDKFRKCFDLYSEALAIGTSLQFLTPVFGEAFINLLIFILAKPDIKMEKRLFEDYLRRQIDVRLKTIHLNCVGFIRPIDASKKEFKDFHTLMNKRNEILHGNIDPKKQSFEEIYFDSSLTVAKYKLFK